MVVNVPLQFNYYHIIYDITFIDKNLANLDMYAIIVHIRVS